MCYVGCILYAWQDIGYQNCGINKFISEGYPINRMLHNVLKEFKTRIGDNWSTLNMYGNPLFLSKDFGARRLKYISQLAIKRPFGYSPLYFLLPWGHVFLK